MLKIASHADVLTGSSRNHSSPTGRNAWRTPKNVCVGSYAKNCFRLTGYSVKVRSQVQTITRAILPRDQLTSVSNSQRGWSCKQIFDSSTTFLNPLVGTNSLYGKRTVGPVTWNCLDDDVVTFNTFNILRVTFLVQGCLPESNIETNRTYFCRVNEAGRALDLWPACQNLGVLAPKWMSCKWGLRTRAWFSIFTYSLSRSGTGLFVMELVVCS